MKGLLKLTLTYLVLAFLFINNTYAKDCSLGPFISGTIETGSFPLIYHFIH